MVSLSKPFRAFVIVSRTRQPSPDSLVPDPRDE